MSAFILKPQYLSCKLICSQSPGAALLKLLADLVILAKHAAEIAPAKKNCARTIGAGNRGFLTKMQACMGNLNAGTDPAQTGFTFKSVHPASARATFTFFQLIC